MPRLLLFAAALLALLAAACGSERPSAPPRPTPTPTLAGAPPAGARTVTDMAGRQVALPETIERVAVLSPSAADYAAAFGLEVIGRPSDVPGPESARAVGTSLAPDFPAIAALQPDLVLADALTQGARIPDFDRFTLPVYLIAAADYRAILQAIDRLGEALDRTGRAADLRAEIESRVTAAALAARDARDRLGPRRVLVLTGEGRDVFAAGAESYIGNLVSILAADNAAASPPEGGPLRGFGVIDPGAAAALQPDVVLILPAGQGTLEAQLRADPAWAATPALRSGRIATLDRTLFLRAPGPRIAEAVETLQRIIWQ